VRICPPPRPPSAPAIVLRCSNGFASAGLHHLQAVERSREVDWGRVSRGRYTIHLNDPGGAAGEILDWRDAWQIEAAIGKYIISATPMDEATWIGVGLDY
jgi:hypothetical protein